MEKEINPNQILRKKEVLALLKISDPTIWRMERDGKFPKRIRLGGAACGWLAAEIDAWLEKKKAARNEARASE